jgi:hypothetical protein
MFQFPPPRNPSLSPGPRALCGNDPTCRVYVSPFRAPQRDWREGAPASRPRVLGADSQRRTVPSMQYLSLASARVTEPYKRLMAAVLRAVVDDCRAGTVYRRAVGYPAIDVRLVRKAAAYVASTDRQWPFSFENLCDALDVDADALRDELRVPSIPA